MSTSKGGEGDPFSPVDPGMLARGLGIISEVSSARQTGSPKNGLLKPLVDVPRGATVHGDRVTTLVMVLPAGLHQNQASGGNTEIVDATSFVLDAGYHEAQRDNDSDTDTESVLSPVRSHPVSVSAPIRGYCSLDSEHGGKPYSIPDSADSSQLPTHETVYLNGYTPEDVLTSARSREALNTPSILLGIDETIRVLHLRELMSSPSRMMVLKTPDTASLSPIELLPTHRSRAVSLAEVLERSYPLNRLQSLRNVSGDLLEEVLRQQVENPTYKAKIITSADEIDRLVLQDSLLRSGATHKSENDLDMIKRNLSGYISTTSTNFNLKPLNLKGSDAPFLFSQGPVLRKARLESISDDTQVHGLQPIKLFETTSGSSKYSETDDDASDKVNAMTNDTELNYIKKQRKRAGCEMANGERSPSRFSIIQKIKSAAPFRSLHKAEDAALNVPAGDGAYHFLDTRLIHEEPAHVLKMSALVAKRNTVMMWTLLAILMACICIFVPLLAISLKCSDTVVRRYLNNISPQHRDQLLQAFTTGNHSTQHDVKKKFKIMRSIGLPEASGN